MARQQNKRTEFVSVRYSRPERAAVKRAAAQAGMWLSGWIRDTTVAATREPLPPSAVELMTVLKEQTAEHRRVGVNLNQLVVTLQSHTELSAAGGARLAAWAARVLAQLETTVGEVTDTNRQLRKRLEER